MTQTFSISAIDFHGDHAMIDFKKFSSAHTALMMDGGVLDGAHLRVSKRIDECTREEL
ncbi:hypothetical protein BDN72DRAFT_843483 [Pluteus cervinus]|uniref:Uncharacterized protein n=1 Tax=Pluteus cervinus TaxID=181527 RepID=A0ACD3ANC3_9AGAR|nr:hypothetical protein BDN72DRAFT_843483 [Pluteus cervinus]